MIGIAVCTYRRPAGLERLLRALPGACGANEVVVLVVDNDGGDPAVAQAIAAAGSMLDIRGFVEPRPGISAARNRAIAEAAVAGVTLLAMIDDDEWPAPGWLDALLATCRETGAAVIGGPVVPVLPQAAGLPRRWHGFWAVTPQRRRGRAFVHATSNVLLDLARLGHLPRPWFDDAFGLSGGGDLVFFSRLFARGVPMAWAKAAVVYEAVPPERATRDWLRRRRFRVGNHMVADETIRQGRLRPALKTAALVLRLAIYPLLGRERRAPIAGWRLEAAKLRGRIAAHRGWRAVEYARDGVTLRRDTEPAPVAVEPSRVLVGIPALNEAAHIEACLRSLVGTDGWMRQVRLVVADGGSGDATVAIAERLAGEFANLTVVANPGRSQAAALNLIAASAEGKDFLVRCDAHAVYPDGYVRGAVERLAALGPDVAAVATVLDATGSSGFGRAAAWVVDTPLGSGGARHRGGRRSGFVDHGHHAAFRLDWFRRVGGYDERFRQNEDAELDHRLGLAGGRVWLAAGLRVAYRMRENLGGLARQYYRYGAGRARMLAHHRCRPRLRQALPVVLLAGLAAAAAGAVVRPWLLLLPAGYGLLLGAVAMRCAVAHRSAGGLWAGPALAAIHHAWAAGFLVGAGSALRARLSRSEAERAASSSTVATPGA